MRLADWLAVSLVVVLLLAVIGGLLAILSGGFPAGGLPW